ncbi:GNAT family N-acetyltransferase [Vibrio algarum]|uniref:GNAT family N-acetyltransferase n=1 Tax=Vibrio algarum TaxID=3020714 RepID=A0ABT4YUE4_9VIBR|nr:GNAT family N-acetyltransferase [Vibrio sp. KJ40-1]MDB1125080.1 GNAT family N-acetyltransferase [Vibrio sp. KJ40-1]
MIKTERLLLTPVTEQDLDIYTQLLTCPETTRYLPGGKPFGLDYIEKYIPQKIAHWDKGFGTCIVSLIDEPSVKIGYAGVELIPEINLCDIRYAILPKYQGQGYAFEAAKAVIDFVLENELVTEVYGVAVTENQASVQLLYKLGMRESSVRLYDSNDLITLST